MSAAPTYQVVFKFQFQQNFASKQIQISIEDSNSFVINGSDEAQVQGYPAGDIPPLLNFSVSGKQLFFNVDSGTTGSGVEGIVWSTFTNGGGSQDLVLDVQFPAGLVVASYVVEQTSSQGLLNAGKNVITVTP